MPCKNNEELLKSVRRRLPEHAQDIYKEVFNNAYYVEYKNPEQHRRGYSSRDEVAAWNAVKNKYVKDKESGCWVVK